MNRLFIIFIINLLSWNLSMAQIPKEAFSLVNSLPDLWIKGETEEAVDSSIKLYRLYPPMFIDRIHNTLAQLLMNDSKLYGQAYLEQLLLMKNEEINKIVTPVYLWCQVINSTDEYDLKRIVEQSGGILTDSANYQSETERYCLLILQELDKKNAIDALTKEKILQKNINNLEGYPYIKTVMAGRLEGEKRAWHRYLLAYSYNYLYTIKPNVEEYLRKASEYSPDLNDKQFKQAYFYDAAILTGNTGEIGFKFKYQKFLADNNRNPELLDLLSEIAFGDPLDENIKSLQDCYEKLMNPEPFNNYWRSYIHKMGKPVPKIKIQFENEELDLTKKSGNWIYIDVWGTWCEPCRNELPALQAFFTDNNSLNLKIYSFSYKSQNLTDFMQKNNYTFPVSEIDKQISDLFEITGYPSKILISPDGNYIKIPYGADWTMYIKNYTLI